jgi:uncharacterized protein (DUF1501 family)
MLHRRDFLRSSSLLALAPVVPLFVTRTAQSAPAAKDSRILVIVQMDGGNDALNTVVPYADVNYEKLRPRLKVDRKELLRISDTVGLHPSLRPLDRLLQDKHLAVIPGVGYPNPNRSHFESMAIWQTARFDPEERKGYGWLGRALDPLAESAYVIGSSVPTALRGRRSAAISLRRVEDVLLADSALAGQPARSSAPDDLLAFVQRQASDAHAASAKLSRLAGKDDNRTYPPTALAERLKLIARLLKSNLGARVFYTSQPGYDTHAAQIYTHASLLSEFSGAVAAFFDDLKAAHLADRVTLLSFSEFARTIKENASAGTDHGTAGAVFLAGPAVRGGVRGTLPSLTDLAGGEPKMTTDFRNVYATLLEDWLRVPAAAVLNGQFHRLELFAG